MLVRGSAGSGKSRLLRWLVHRADELGCATVISGRSDPETGDIADGFRLFTGSGGLSKYGAAAQIRWRLRGQGTVEDCDAFATWLEKPETGPGPPRRLLSVLAEQGPVIVALDDAQYGSDALRLLGQLADLELPILAVAAIREEDIGVQRGLLERLRAVTGFSELPLGPLGEMEQLVREMLGLEPGLAARVCAMSSNNPGLAVRMVGNMVAQGALVISPAGFGLRDGASPGSPTDLFAGWEEAVARSLETADVAAERGAVLAALMGAEVGREAWKRASEGLGLTSAGLDALVGSGLMHRTRAGWVFANAWVRGALRLRATPDLHRACAPTMGDPARRAHHLLRGGSLEEALEPTMFSARRAMVAGRVSAAEQLLQQYFEILDRLEAVEEDRRRIQGWLRWASLYRRSGRHALALENANRALEAARRGGWSDLQAKAEAGLGFAYGQHDPALARQHLERSLLRFEDDPVMAAAVHEELSLMEGRLGLLQASNDRLKTVIRLARLANRPLQVAIATDKLAHQSIKLGHIDEGVRLQRLAADLFTELGDKNGEACVENTLGECARAKGDLAAAQAHFQRAARLWRALGSPNAIVAELNTCILLVSQHRFAEAERRMVGRRREIERNGVELFRCAWILLTASCSAGRAEWRAAEEQAQEAVQRMKASSLVDPDVADLLDLYADVCKAAGQASFARAAAAEMRSRLEMEN